MRSLDIAGTGLLAQQTNVEVISNNIANMTTTGFKRRRAEFRGRMREFWVWPHEKHYIWGATAAILVNLARVLLAGLFNFSLAVVGDRPDDWGQDWLTGHA